MHTEAEHEVELAPDVEQMLKQLPQFCVSPEVSVSQPSSAEGAAG